MLDVRFLCGQLSFFSGLSSGSPSVEWIYKKLCYRKEDSASAALSWLTSLSALFSATYGLDIPDFSNWCLSRAHRGHISAFWQGTSHRCLSIMPSFSVISANIAISDIPLKTRFFGLHFRCGKSWCIFNHFYVISPDIIIIIIIIFVYL